MDELFWLDHRRMVAQPNEEIAATLFSDATPQKGDSPHSLREAGFLSEVRLTAAVSTASMGLSAFVSFACQLAEFFAFDPRCRWKTALVLAGDIHMVRLVAINRNRLFDVSFHGLYENTFLRRDKSDCSTSFARAGSSADAVHVGFCLQRQFHLHDKIDFRNIDAAARNVRCDEYAELSALESGKCTGALRVGFIRMWDRRDPSKGLD